MSTIPPNFTRGSGLLEPLLARLRANKANRLIPKTHRKGRILDIGCGSYPYFLANTEFSQKFGVDQLAVDQEIINHKQITWHKMNFNEIPKLPFKENFFTIVTLLAVVEHIDPSNMALLFKEIYRVLEPGGMVILTTPAQWSDGLLKLLAGINLVSAEEIKEHVFTYTLPFIGWYFGQAGFKMDQTHFGYFEFMLNIWATATK